jgi:hypothetical protein
MNPNQMAIEICLYHKRHLRGQRQRRWMRWFIGGAALYGLYAVI